MGLDSFKGGAEKEKKGIKWSKPKLHKPHLCPHCGTDNTTEREYDWKCNADNCDTLTYIPANYEVSI